METQLQACNMPSDQIMFISPVDLKQFSADTLGRHNTYRRMHGARPLQLRPKIARHAQCWADQLATDDRMSPNPDRRYGENIYTCSGFEPTGFHVSDAWYAENEDKCYDYDKAEFTPAAAHFTTMVWRETRQLGVGIALSATGRYYVVASYWPVGNVRQQFAENVLPPKQRTGVSIGWAHLTRPCAKLCASRFNQFQLGFLCEQNDWRTLHSAESLRLNADLCEEAQKWADHLAAANEVTYMALSWYGQNIDYLKATAATDKGRPIEPDDRPLRRWYSELRQYGGKLTPQTSHFTQMVWRSSRDLGVGVARSRTGEVYTVAHYFPPGNIEGMQDRNVKNWQREKARMDRNPIDMMN